MRDISEIRKDIDSIDAQLVALFEKRMALSEEVAFFKKENSLPVLNSSREDEVIEKVCSQLENQELCDYTSKLFRVIMNLSKEYQNSL